MNAADYDCKAFGHAWDSAAASGADHVAQCAQCGCIRITSADRTARVYVRLADEGATS